MVHGVRIIQAPKPPTLPRAPVPVVPKEKADPGLTGSRFFPVDWPSVVFMPLLDVGASKQVAHEALAFRFLHVKKVLAALLREKRLGAETFLNVLGQLLSCGQTTGFPQAI